MENIKNAIEVRDVKKFFKVYYDRGITVKDKILSRGRSRYEKRQVLKGITFDVKRGEAVGLIGKNGCGKSTTLKLLTKIIYPNEGTIELRGRVSSLLELGAGFHPDMSGRENIYMNAAVFGLTRKEIEKRVQDIIEFSELEDYIENPVRTYSSGMYMRLAFSVAINVDADVLLIDEILAVGDVSFQRKCFDRLKEIKNQGTTIVIVSHSFDQIEKICDRSIWISDGIIREEGIPKVVHKHYLAHMEEARIGRLVKKQSREEELLEEAQRQKEADKAEKAKKEAQKAAEETRKSEEAQKTSEEAQKTEADTHSKEEAEKKEEALPAAGRAEEEAKKQQQQWITDIKKNDNLLEHLSPNVNRRGDKRVELTRINVVDSQGKQELVFRTGDSMTILVEFLAHGAYRKGTLGIGFYREDGVYCFGTNTFIEKQQVLNLSEESMILIHFDQLNLLPGKYRITVGMHDDIKADFYDQVDRAVPIEMVNLKGDLGVCRLHSQWTCIGKE